MSRRPLRPAPQPTREEQRAERRFTWRVLLIGVCTNFIGCGVHYLFIAPPRLGGAMVRPAPPTNMLPPLKKAWGVSLPGP